MHCQFCVVFFSGHRLFKCPFQESKQVFWGLIQERHENGAWDGQVVGIADTARDHHGEEGAEHQVNAFDLPVDLRSDPHRRS